MAERESSVGVARVERKLSRAWAFLSGEQRVFHYTVGNHGVLQFAEFSFFMPLTVAKDARHGGVGVLIQHGDAVQVAAHMFGVPRQAVQEVDLRDACAEVCNVFSDCIATDFSAEQTVTIGLPRAAGPMEYQRIAENSVARAVYHGSAGAHRLLIVLYDSLRLSP